ncbi:unnamed protein product [Closterium sp. Yama58-4]|nr:unnamed protein product [Closterium sp. Yama58-4]
MTKVYQAWKGSNRFLCWGRFIFGPDVRSLVISFVLILVPGTLFCIFVAAPYAGKLPGGIAVLPVSICFVIWNLFILLVTASRDPGIVPRNLVPPQPDEEAGEQGAGGAPKKLPRAKEVVVNGHTVKVKYCDTCLLYRPPRCSHCSICDNCIEKFDHHCPWVGQCIGRRNYPFFFLFVTTTTLLCIFVFTLSAFYIKLLVDNSYPGASGESISLLEALGKGYMAAVLMVYTFIMVWFVGGLTGFHSFLISRNQTTYENFRARYEKKANPYNRGCLRNWRSVLCSPIPPSRHNFRADAPEPPPAVPPVTDPASSSNRALIPTANTNGHAHDDAQRNGNGVPYMNGLVPYAPYAQYNSTPSPVNKRQSEYDLVEATRLTDDEGGRIADQIVELGRMPDGYMAGGAGDESVDSSGVPRSVSGGGRRSGSGRRRGEEIAVLEGSEGKERRDEAGGGEEVVVDVPSAG